MAKPPFLDFPDLYNSLRERSNYTYHEGIFCIRLSLQDTQKLINNASVGGCFHISINPLKKIIISSYLYVDYRCNHNIIPYYYEDAWFLIKGRYTNLENIIENTGYTFLSDSQKYLLASRKESFVGLPDHAVYLCPNVCKEDSE